jgi:hypothetical protein
VPLVLSAMTYQMLVKFMGWYVLNFISMKPGASPFADVPVRSGVT